MSRLLIATTNEGKQRELRRLLAHLPALIITPNELQLHIDVEEPHDTYAENAAEKARVYAEATGVVSLADDSGIEVAALDWGPGVRSARWAGDRGREADRMLDALAGVTDRRARMVCVVAVAVPLPNPPSVDVFTGIVTGSIATEKRGSGGFGYDPVFVIEDLGATTGELSEAEKDRRSHRGRAVAAATPRLLEILSLSSDPLI